MGVGPRAQLPRSRRTGGSFCTILHAAPTHAEGTFVALMSKRKTRTSMADQNQHASSKTAEGGSGKAARVTPVPKGARRPPPTPTTADDASSYDVSVPFEFRNWQVGSRFHIKRFLGRGSYGSVCEATDKLTGERVAIKRITDLFDVKVRNRRDTAP